MTGAKTLFLAFFFTAGLTASSAAQSNLPAFPHKLDVPVKCSLGQDCFIHGYVDTDPEEGWSDYRCGSLSKNNHSGTDFRVRTLKDMNRGVAVIAAADGTVFNIRDGIEDRYFLDHTKEQKKEIYKHALGNAVILYHGKGWNSFYGHLKKGSVQVRKNQKVKKGDILGYVGLSGLTDFPHLHFELRHKGKRIDPFTARQRGSGCAKAVKTYWSKKALSELVYQRTAFLITGFSETRPKGRKDLESGEKAQQELHAMAPTLFFWSYYIGSREGDIVRLKILDPEGIELTQSTNKPQTKHTVSKRVFLGEKRPASGWKKGLYRGEITIDRNGTILKDSAVISVR